MPGLRKPTPLPHLQGRTDADAAWLTGWWSGAVVAFVLGFGTAVLVGALR